jgi:MoxR-like ATPase
MSDMPANPLQPVLFEVKRTIVGQDVLLERMAIALLSGGHLLVEGVPGLAKTLSVKSLAAAVGGQFQRIQFTPDLVPADLTGTRVYHQHTGEFQTQLGPVFTNLLLADEINRAPAKVQSALLEVMQEHQVTIGRETYQVPEPFLVMATQNPIESEGTYPLPEAQLDRFLVKLTVPVPGRDDEISILARHAAGFDPGDLGAAGIRPVASAADLAAARAAVDGVQVAPEVTGYIVDLCRATRQSPSLRLGVSPRGATALQATARAWAWLAGRDFVIPDDVKALARPALRHRIQLRPEAELEGATADGVLDAVLGSIPVPR